jgi:REP element-mobilizing transposase RayT
MQTTPTPKGSANRPPPGRPPVLPPAPPSGSNPATPVSPVSTYWAVFRLTDAMPAELVTRLRSEEEEANRTDGGDEAALRRRIAQRIEAELNAGHGDCWLRDEQVARLVQSALQAGHGRRYTLRAWSVLPNHLQVIFTTAEGVDAGAVVREWRSYTTSQVNLALDRGAVELWERLPYLRALEDEAEVMRRIRNVEFRAVNAGLCRRPRDWKWSSAHESAPPPVPRGGGGNGSSGASAGVASGGAVPPASTGGAPRPVNPPRPRPG